MRIFICGILLNLCLNVCGQTTIQTGEIPGLLKIELSHDSFFSDFGTKVKITNISSKPISIIGNSLSEFFEQYKVSMDSIYYNIHIGDAPSGSKEKLDLIKIQTSKTYSAYCNIDSATIAKNNIKIRFIINSVDKGIIVYHSIFWVRSCLSKNGIRQGWWQHDRTISSGSYSKKHKVYFLILE